MSSEVLSVVVVAYAMARELPRTLRTLAPGYQRDLDGVEVEIVVVDNGSPEPVRRDDLTEEPGVRLLRIDDADPSPVAAANAGVSVARGDLIGLFVDGARMASPGLLAGARRAARLVDEPVITAPAFHLGPVPHMRASEVNYDQRTEDRLLTEIGWEDNGYRLFRASVLGGSSSRGLFGVKGESNSLFLRRHTWERLGGMDERFALPGGGLANHDLYRRACELDGTTLIELLGEATFHQYHGGAATSGRFRWDDMHAEYVAITGRRHRPPPDVPIHVGTVRTEVLEHVEASARSAIDRSLRNQP